MAAPTSGMDSQPQARTPEMTHIEIKRVQNGFVVAAINANLHEHMMGYKGPQLMTFIAKDTTELSALLEWIVTGKDLNWLPTIDTPVFDQLVRRGNISPDQLQDAVRTAVQSAFSAPTMLAEPAHDLPAHKPTFFGGPLNRR